MKEYIGTKIVKAEPAKRFRMKDGSCLVVGLEEVVSQQILKDAKGCEEGYRVLYADGYKSWSPKDVFEGAYRETHGGMNFGMALEAVKLGGKIARTGWNGKGQYVELASCISYKNSSGFAVNAEHRNIGNKALAFVGTGGVQMGWLASQADMLADDWVIVG